MMLKLLILIFFFFFFNDTATTEIYTLSLHDALPICHDCDAHDQAGGLPTPAPCAICHECRDRKSTRLNSSHGYISYAVFCLKKKKATLTPNALDHAIAVDSRCPFSTAASNPALTLPL